MKAHRTIDKKFQKRIRDEVAEEFKKQSNDMTRRVIKAICVSLNQEYGFGKIRLLRLIDRLEEISKEREHDEVFWSHIDIYCKHLGLDFPDEDYEKMDK